MAQGALWFEGQA